MVKKLVMISMVSIFLLSGCSRDEIEVPLLQEPVASDIDTAMVTRGDIYNLTTYDSKVYPAIRELSFSVDGRLKDIEVHLGQEVQKGDLLISLNDESLKRTLEGFKKELNDRETNYGYDNQLLDLDIQLLEMELNQMRQENAPAIEVTLLEADLEKLELKKRQNIELQTLQIDQLEKKIYELKEEIKKYKLVAPEKGEVVYVKYDVIGSRYGAYDTVVILADSSKLHIQSEFIAQNTIQRASQIYGIINDKEYEIEYLPLEVDEKIKLSNGVTGIESRFAFQPDSGVQVGDFASIHIKDQLKTDVIIIPKKAIYKDSDGTFVYRLEEDKLIRCDIQTGIETDVQVEVISGLKEGDVVYVQG